MAAVVMIVVIAVVGAGAYFGFGKGASSTAGSTSTTTGPKSVTCQPATAPQCSGVGAAHDITVQAPFKAVQSGNTIPFTATLPSGEDSSVWTVDFGDGSTSTSSASANSYTASHAYGGAGTYIVSVTAMVGTSLHDSYHGLLIVVVSASYSSTQAGNAPEVGGSIPANSTSTSAATAVLTSSGTVTLAGTYAAAPTNPLFTVQTPTFVASTGGTLTGTTGAGNSLTTTASFGSSGVHWVTFVGSAIGPNSQVAYQNYTWTVFVAPLGANAIVAGSGASVSPHKGQIITYELVPGGSQGEDPAIDYESAGYEPIINTYQTLIAYNGSVAGPSPNDYVPELATCVPGSGLCTSLYGNNLTNGQYYTFVLDPNAQFYDPATAKHWSVWPTDVMFSIFRTMGFSTVPSFASTNGWILTQSLLTPGSTSWDGGLHGALNNTPINMFNAVSLNNTSAGCPSTAVAPEGCVTFNAYASGHVWGYFLELIADNFGGSIESCAWFTSMGSYIPYWTQGNVTNADAPCGAPGSTGWGVPVGSIPATGYDNWEAAGGNANGNGYLGNTQWNLLGSGPYYASIVQGTSYELKANPYYVQPACGAWTNPAGCEPAAGHYAGDVQVTWETSELPGEEAYASGVADFASIPSTETSLLLQLIEQGKVSALSFPTINIYFFPFTLNFNPAATAQYSTNPITVPGDFFSYVGLRQFFAHAYPYQTIQNTINTKNGIQYLLNYGGAIPNGLANFYPTNVSWPSGDPDTNPADVGGAAWWWAQINSASSPYYDPQLAGCSPSAPCEFPMFGETGAPDLDERIALWQAEVSTLSGGAIKMDSLDINFIDLVINSIFQGPGQSPMPVYTLGWLPDYPDPTDYVAPLYQENSTYTHSGAIEQQTSLTAFNASSCHNWQDYGYWSSNPVPNNCQGAAYQAMLRAMGDAAVAPTGPHRVLLYNMAESIANSLALYIYWGQQNAVLSFSSWVDGSTIDTNPTLGGADIAWYFIGGNGVY